MNPVSLSDIPIKCCLRCKHKKVMWEFPRIVAVEYAQGLVVRRQTSPRGICPDICLACHSKLEEN
jgi:hypothetical protein